MPITVDLERSPLVICTFEGGATDAEFEAYLVRLTRNLQSARTTATVLDMTTATPATLAQRKMQSDWVRTHTELLSRYSVGTAFCFASAIFRFILSGLLVMERLPTPYHMCKTREEGIGWATGQLRRAGVAV